MTRHLFGHLLVAATAVAAIVCPELAGSQSAIAAAPLAKAAAAWSWEEPLIPSQERRLPSPARRRAFVSRWTPTARWSSTTASHGLGPRASTQTETGLPPSLARPRAFVPRST